MKLYSENNELYTALNKLGDLVLLNVLFVVSCIPVITIGAALTSMYSVTNKMVQQENIKIFSDYKNAFIKNFKQATLIWIFILVAIFILIADIQILGVFQNSILLGLILGVILLLFMITSYIFPLIACFYNTTFMYIKNALLLACLNIVKTLVILVVNVLPFLVLFTSGLLAQFGYFIYLLIGFSATAYLVMKLLSKVFKKYVNKDMQEKEN